MTEFNNEHDGPEKVDSQMEVTDPNKKEVYVPVEPPKVSPKLIVRAAVYVVAIANAGAAVFGFDPGWEISNQENVYELLSTLFLIGSYAHAWWENQDFSKNARKRKDVADQAEPEEKLTDKLKKKDKEKKI